MAERKTRILIADDQADVIEALRLLLKAEGYEIDKVVEGLPWQHLIVIKVK